MNSTFQFGVHTGGYARTVNTEDGPVERWVEQFDVGCGDAKGNRWILAVEAYATEAAAEAAIQKVIASGSTPISQPDHWLEDRPVYGSEAWGAEDEYELACFEADCYDEPRPRW